MVNRIYPGLSEQIAKGQEAEDEDKGKNEGEKGDISGNAFTDYRHFRRRESVPGVFLRGHGTRKSKIPPGG